MTIEAGRFLNREEACQYTEAIQNPEVKAFVEYGVALPLILAGTLEWLRGRRS